MLHEKSSNIKILPWFGGNLSQFTHVSDLRALEAAKICKFGILSVNLPLVLLWEDGRWPRSCEGRRDSMRIIWPIPLLLILMNLDEMYTQEHC